MFLAALESGRYSLASVIDDAPIIVELDRRRTWTPANFDDQAHGLVPLVRALAESFNMATVRLGLDVGLEPIADTLQRLGLKHKPTLYPSMLLGALALTPIEVAQIYNTLANGGFRVPLRAVRSVVGEDGELLQRYEIEITQAADAGAVYALNQALVQVMERGTGRTVRRADARRHRRRRQDRHVRRSARQLVRGLHERPFDRHLDRRRRQSADRPHGLHGRGEDLGRVLSALEANSYSAPPPDGVDEHWIDYLTGESDGRALPRRHRRARARTRTTIRACSAATARPASARASALGSAAASDDAMRCGRRSRAARCSPMSRCGAACTSLGGPPSRPAPSPRSRARAAGRASAPCAPPRRAAARHADAAALRAAPPPRTDVPAARPQSDATGASGALLEQSRAQRAAGSLPAARASLERALRLDPNNPEVWLELGELELQTGNVTQATTMARKALTLTGRDARLEARAERLLRAAE